MGKKAFQALNLAIAVGFTAVFAAVVVPALVENPDIIGAFGAGFVNPFASGYASDVFFCWGALAVWVIYEAKTHNIRHGWVCLALGVVPGVAVGLSLYLILRQRQLQEHALDPKDA